MSVVLQSGVDTVKAKLNSGGSKNGLKFVIEPLKIIAIIIAEQLIWHFEACKSIVLKLTV